MSNNNGIDLEHWTEMIYLRALRIFSPYLLVAISFPFPVAQSRLALPAVATVESAAPPAIVFGFVGGFVKYNDIVHNEVQLAARLRKEYPTGTVVEIFENHSGDGAYNRILSLLDKNHEGTPSTDEKRNARIILYGHSWGASEIVTLARRLEKAGIPVLLTVQVDSVPKSGENDVTIPANVAQAANFYQAEGLLRGEPEIRAADKTRTKIIGNFQFSYGETPYACSGYPWYARVFMKAHTQIECDPKVWGEIEALIRSSLPVAKENAAER
jgi:hypothetical protein